MNWKFNFPFVFYFLVLCFSLNLASTSILFSTNQVIFDYTIIQQNLVQSTSSPSPSFYNLNQPRGMTISPDDGSLWVVQYPNQVYQFDRTDLDSPQFNFTFQNLSQTLSSISMTEGGILFFSVNGFLIRFDTNSTSVTTYPSCYGNETFVTSNFTTIYVVCSNLTNSEIVRIDTVQSTYNTVYNAPEKLGKIWFSDGMIYIPFYSSSIIYVFDSFQSMPVANYSVQTPISLRVSQGVLYVACSPNTSDISQPDVYVLEDGQAPIGARIPYSASPYDVEVLVDCPGNGTCSGNGICSFLIDTLSPVCVCNGSFTGSDCSSLNSTPSTSSVSSSSILIYIIIGVVVGAVILILLVVCIICLPKGQKKEEEELIDTVDLAINKSRFQTLQRSPSTLSLQDSLGHWNIDFKEIDVKKKLGSGAFGIVYLGIWRNSECAVKQLLLNGNDEHILKQFLKEINTMKNIRPHPHVIGMLGVCVSSEYPFCIVTEFMSNGSLDHILADPNYVFDCGKSLTLGYEVASGMAHLHAEKVLHCDLSARNLLCRFEKDKLVVKVADFGLSHITESSAEYDASNEHKFPVKWSAPEVILHRKFSTANDVWSFGVVMYEILARRLPYAGMGNKEVIKEVCDNGYRLEKPNPPFDYPSEVYDMMMECWNTNPEKRPSFDMICQRLRMLNPSHGADEDLPEIQPKSISDGSKVYSENALDDQNSNAYNAMELNEDYSYQGGSPISNTANEPGRRVPSNPPRGSQPQPQPQPQPTEDFYNNSKNEERDGEDYQTFSKSSPEENYN